MDNQATILLVDDEPANIQVLANFLKSDYQLKVATSGKQCLELLSSDSKPDLIILDIDMPEMDGYEVCRRLKMDTETSSIPVIFVTAMQSEQDEEKGLNLGAVDYLTKPVRPAILLARINTHIELKKQRDKLTRMAMRDQLTGLYNPYYLLEVANHRVARATRNNISVSLLMLDIDHFKLINDTYGHAEGDTILKVFAELLKVESRKEDVVARFGGEEFVIFLDHCNSSGASEIAERVRTKTEKVNIGKTKFTVSIGIAELKNGEEGFSDLIVRADNAMYKAKTSGRNQVVIDQ